MVRKEISEARQKVIQHLAGKLADLNPTIRADGEDLYFDTGAEASFSIGDHSEDAATLFICDDTTEEFVECFHLAEPDSLDKAIEAMLSYLLEETEKIC